MYIDSHCHLNHRRIETLGKPEAIVQNARAAGINGMLTICCRIHEEMESLKAIADANTNVWCSIGTHPHDASDAAEKATTQDQIVAMANAHPKIIGIGESGLDYYYDNSDRNDQADSFRKHIRACVETGLPLIVHARDADEDVIKILREEGAGKNGLKGVMHCFSSGAQMARDALDIGFYISFSGILTFKNAGDLRDIAKFVPIDRALIETDAPYLAPEPHRKEINQPALVIHTATMLANIHDLTSEEVGAKTASNFFDLFDKAKDTWQQAA
ncbi:MAG TPA: TatD family hydrolase [Alphaproteobacteria bacterium]